MGCRNAARCHFKTLVQSIFFLFSSILLKYELYFFYNAKFFFMNDETLLLLSDLEAKQSISKQNQYPCLSGNDIGILDFKVIYPAKDENNNNVFISLKFGEKKIEVAGSMEKKFLYFSHIEIDKELYNRSGFIRSILIRSKLIAIKYNKRLVYFSFKHHAYNDSIYYSFSRMNFSKRSGTRGTNCTFTFTADIPKKPVKRV